MKTKIARLRPEKVQHAGELYRAYEDGRICRPDRTTLTMVEPLAFRDAQILINRVKGPFASVRIAEDGVVAALRDWDDRSRADYWRRP